MPANQAGERRHCADGAGGQATGLGGQHEPVDGHAKIHVAPAAKVVLDGHDKGHGRVEKAEVAFELSIAPGFVVTCNAQRRIERLSGRHLSTPKRHGHGLGKVVVVLSLVSTLAPCLYQLVAHPLADLAPHGNEAAGLQIGATGGESRGLNYL